MCLLWPPIMSPAPLGYLESCVSTGLPGLCLSEKMRIFPEEDSLEEGLNSYASIIGQVESVHDSDLRA